MNRAPIANHLGQGHGAAHLDLSRVGLHRGQAMMIVELVWQGLFGNGPVLAGATG